MLSKEQLDMSDEEYYFSSPNPHVDEIEFAVISKIYHMQNKPGYNNPKEAYKIISAQIKKMIEEYFVKQNHLEDSKK